MNDIKTRANLFQTCIIFLFFFIHLRALVTRIIFGSRTNRTLLCLLLVICWLLLQSLLLFIVIAISIDILAVENAISNSYQCLKHHLTSLLREEDECSEEHLKSLSHQRFLPVEFLVEPLDEELRDDANNSIVLRSFIFIFVLIFIRSWFCLSKVFGYIRAKKQFTYSFYSDLSQALVRSEHVSLKDQLLEIFSFLAAPMADEPID